jgi:hypothetical protein
MGECTAETCPQVVWVWLEDLVCLFVLNNTNTNTNNKNSKNSKNKQAKNQTNKQAKKQKTP